jgi:hypothetical protein
MRKLILAACCISLLSGCSVTKNDISYATSLCRENGGIEVIRLDGLRFRTVTCGNGATFSYSHDFR